MWYWSKMTLFLTIKQLKNGWVNSWGPLSNHPSKQSIQVPLLTWIPFFLKQNLVILFKIVLNRGESYYLARFSNHVKLGIVLIEIVLTGDHLYFKLRPFDLLVWSDDCMTVQQKYFLSIFEFFEFPLYISTMEFLIANSSKMNFSAWNVQVMISLVTPSKKFLKSFSLCITKRQITTVKSQAVARLG